MPQIVVIRKNIDTDSLSADEKEDLGLLLLMQQADVRDTVLRAKVKKELEK